MKPASIIEDPIGSLVQDNHRLLNASDSEFAHLWLHKILHAELCRYSMENAYINLESKDYLKARRALAELEASRDWINPLLREFLVACRQTAKAPQLAIGQEVRQVKANGTTVPVRGRKALGTSLFWVSRNKANYLPLVEENASNPEYSRGLLKAYASRINELKETAGVTHLCFIEKEMGPIGTLSMLSSLVIETNLPACIYRETHWAPTLALVGDKLSKKDRIAIVYDLLVTGAGIGGAADFLKDRTGADTVAAVILCGYGQKRATFKSKRLKQTIVIDALDWKEDIQDGPRFDFPARDGDEARTVLSEPRQPQRQEVDVRKRKELISAGYYTRETLPPASDRVRKMLEENRRNLPYEIDASPPKSRGKRITLMDKTVRSIQLEKGGRSVRIKG